MTTPSPSIDYLQHPPILIQREIAVGKRLVIMAEAEEGDYYDPTLVYHTDMARDFFGGGALIQAYEDASTFDKGLHVFLMRIEPYQYELALSVLESFEFDLLYIQDVHYDTHREVIDMFLEFAKIKEEKGNLIHGITTLSPDKDYADLTLLFDSIKELTKEVGDDLVETGKYLSLVYNQGELKDAGAVYAGIVASVDPQVSPINKTIPDFALSRELSKQEILKLRSVGIVCFKSTFKKGVTCTSSSCAVSTDGSVHKHISNFRIAQYLINEVAAELQPFIGKPHVLLQAHNVEDIINAVCLEHVRLQRIRDYDYYLTVTELYGMIEVEIELVPIFSVHAMTTHTRVRIFK